MSDHNIPLTDLEKSGLQKHGLPIGSPSQLSDAFRHGVKWAEARVAELNACACDEEMMCKYHGERTRNGQAWLLRKQAEAVDDFRGELNRKQKEHTLLNVAEECINYAQRLRQQDEAEDG